MKNYHFFWGGPFSNWYPAEFDYKGQHFYNSEQAFMWEKAKHFGDEEIAEQILAEQHPAVAKRLGRMVKNYSDEQWAEVRFEKMVAVNFAKFSQNEKLRVQLQFHGNYVEASPEDRIWGIGMREGEPGIEDPKNWKGTNLLGEALNNVKAAIVAQQQSQHLNQ